MYSGFLPQSKDMQVRLTGDSKLPVGVNVSVNRSLYISPVIDWQPVQGVHHLLPHVSWDQLQPPLCPLKISGIDNGCMKEQNEQQCMSKPHMQSLVEVQRGTYSWLQALWCSHPVDQQQRHFLLDRRQCFSCGFHQ